MSSSNASLHNARRIPGVSQQEDDSSAYNVSLGQRFVLQSKYLVTFRMVDSIMVFYVADPDSNPLISLRYVDAAAKILVGLSKGVDISHRRLAKKYSDLYTLLGKLLARGVRHLPSAFVHAPATEEKLLTMPVSVGEGKRKVKKLLESRKTKNAFVRTTSEGSEGGEAGGVGGGGGADERVRRGQQDVFVADEALMEQVHARSGFGVRSVEFEVPSGALPPPPGRVAGAVVGGNAGMHLRLSEALMERAWSGAVTSEQDSEEGSDEGREDGDLETRAWSEAEEASRQETICEATDDRLALEHCTEREEQRRIRRQSIKQAVVMVEVWKGEVKGDALRGVSVEGSIRRALAPYNVDRVLFRVRPSGSFDVDACMQVASLHKKYGRMVEETGFSVVMSGIPIDATYLKYALPKASVRPPLQASLVIGTQRDPMRASRKETTLLVCIPYAVDPALPVNFLVDVVVTLAFPPDVDGLVNTSDMAVWCPIHSKVQWTLARLDAGEAGVLRAVVRVKSGSGTVEEAVARVCSGTVATVLFSGCPGRSYSGLGFAVGDDDLDVDRESNPSSEKEFFPGNVRTFGELKLVV